MIKKRISKFIIYITLILLAAIFVTPILIVLTNSFMSSFEIINRYTHTVRPGNMFNTTDIIHYVRFTLIPDHVSFDQYIKLFFSNPIYLERFWNSILLALPIILGQIIISIPSAYAFEMSGFRHKEKIYFAYIVIMLLPLQVTLVPNFIVADWLGILDNRIAVILPSVFSPFGVFLLRQYLRGLPREYTEAAQIDGASHLRIIFAIVAPIFKPAVAALIILTFVNSWNIVEQAIIFLTASQMPLSVYLGSIAERNLDMIYAASFFYLLPPLLMFLYWKEYLTEGITLSGIR
jgi:multiple sugar transport system permease protein